MSLAISKPTPDSLNSSIAIVISADQKVAISSKEVTPTKRINEQESYAAIIHHSLSGTKPKLAQRFEKELKAANDQFKKNHGNKSDMFKVSDRLMRQYVREKEITSDEYKSIKHHAFGSAQLDSDRTRLSSVRAPEAKDGDTPVRAISTLYKKLETNTAATPDEIAQFRAHEALISKAKWQETHKGSSPTNSIGQSNAEVGTAEIKKLSTKGLPSGFLWKPQSESDGRLVVLLPSSLTSVVNSVRLKNPKGAAELDVGRYSGIGNGMRLHFRFGKSGSSYPDGTLVEVVFTDGSKMQVPITNTGSRVES